MPSDDVIEAFNEIKSKSPSSFEPMLTYFETYYIGNLKTNSKSIRQEPMFPISLWNVYDRVSGDLARTTNSVEVWHKNFESDCKKHPTVYGLVNKFKDEQGLTDAVLDQIEAGDCYYKRGDVVLKEEKLKLLCKNYSNNGKFVDYLASISYNL